MPQAEKNAEGRVARANLRPTFTTQALRVAAEPDLIVWPETCYPADWSRSPPGEYAVDRSSPGRRRGLREEFRSHPPGDAHAPRPQRVRVGRRPRVEVQLRGAARRRGASSAPATTRCTSSRSANTFRSAKRSRSCDWFTPYENDYSCRPGEHWTRFRAPDRGRPQLHLRVPHLLRGLRPVPRAAIRRRMSRSISS